MISGPNALITFISDPMSLMVTPSWSNKRNRTIYCKFRRTKQCSICKNAVLCSSFYKSLSTVGLTSGQTLPIARAIFSTEALRRECVIGAIVGFEWSRASQLRCRLNVQQLRKRNKRLESNAWQLMLWYAVQSVAFWVEVVFRNVIRGTVLGSAQACRNRRLKRSNTSLQSPWRKA